MKDRIDEGSSPVYSLWLSNVAQSGVSHRGHPIVDERHHDARLIGHLL